MRALIIGATGLLGNALFRLWSARPGWKASGTYRYHELPGMSRLDLLDREATAAAIKSSRAEVVALPVSNPHVDYCEANPEATRDLNVSATLAAARAAAESGARVVFFSTDYVFDGARGGYREGDPTGPLCEYGRQKLEVERSLASLGDKVLVLRMSALFGWELRPRNFALQVLEKLRSGQRMRVATDQDYNPTYVEDLASALAELLERGTGGLLHAAGSQKLTRAEFASQIADCFGLDKGLLVPGLLRDIAPASAAPRPLHSSLVSAKAEALLGRRLWSAREGLEHMKRTRPVWQGARR